MPKVNLRYVSINLFTDINFLQTMFQTMFLLRLYEKVFNIII